MATEAVEEIERDIAASLLEESKKILKLTLKLWPIVVSAREAELVDDEFVDNLMKQRLPANSKLNAANLSMLIDQIKEKESWFGRLMHMLSVWPSYRPLAEQLTRSE